MEGCPIKDDKYKKLLAHLGSQEKVYKAWRLFGNTIPTVEEFKAGPQEKVVDKNPRFIRILNDLKQNKQKFNKYIDNAKSELGTSSPEEKVKLKKSIKAYKKSIDDLDERINSIEKYEDVYKITEQAELDLGNISSILSKSTITDSELYYMANTLNMWKEMGNFDGGNMMLSDKEFEKSKEEDTSLNDFRKEMIVIADKANRLSDILHKKNEEFLNVKLAKLKAGKVDVNDILKDIGLPAAFLLDISKNDYALIQAMYNWNSKATMKSTSEATDIVHGLSKIFKKINIKPDVLYDMLAQTQSNKDKRLTGNLVHRFSQSYFDSLKTLRNKRDSRISDAMKNTAINDRNKHLSEIWDEFNKAYKDIVTIFDVRKLFPDAELYDKTFSNEDIEKHKSELVNILGKSGYEELLESAKAQVESFKLDRLAELEDIRDRLGENAPESAVQNELKSWELENSPYYYAEQYNDGFKRTHAGAFVSPKGTSVTFIPKKTDSKGRDLGFYDDKFKKVESNSNIYELYKYLTETIKELNGYLPEDKRKHLQSNTLQNIHKGMLEQFLGGQMYNGLKDLYGSIIESQRENVGSNMEPTSETDVYGRKIDTIRTDMFGGNEKRITDYVDKQTALWSQNGKKGDLKALRKEWRKDIQDVIAKESTPDIEKIIKTYSLAAITYKHKAEIEDSMRIAHNFIKNLVKSEQTLSDETVLNEFGNPKLIKGNTPENIIKQLDHYMQHFYGEKTQSVEMVYGNKTYTPEEVKEKEELEKILESGNLEPELQAKIIKQLNSLGGYKTGGRHLDTMNQWVRLKGLAWNPFAGMANSMFGFISNMIEAGGGLSFNQNELMFGYRETLHYFNKVSNIMEKYGLLQELQSEINNKNKSKKWIEPFGFQHKTEILNQGPIVVAMLKREKIKINGKEVSFYDVLGSSDMLPSLSQEDLEKLNSVLLKIKENIKDTHGNYDSESPIMANKYVLGRSLMVFRKWMINSYYNRLAGEHVNIAKGITDKGRWRSYGSYVGNKGWMSIPDLLMQTLRKIAFQKTTFNDGLNEIDAANMRKNMNELMFLMVVTVLALMIKATDDDDDPKARYLANFWINNLTRMQTDLMFYVSPDQFKTILKDPVPLMSLVTDTQKALSRSFALMDGVDESDIYQQGPYKEQVKAGVSVRKLIPGANILDRFESMRTQIYNKDGMLMKMVSEQQ